MDLAGRRVLVVGGSRGIGAAFALGARAAGARVVATARSSPQLPDVVGASADVRDPDACRDLVEHALSALGGLDALLYCPALLPLAALADTTAGTWAEVFETNVRGAALVTAAALPALVESAGHAVYLSSDIVATPRVGLGAYAVSKAALDELVDVWRLEVADVSFTRVTLGPTLTTIAAGWDLDVAAAFFAQWQEAGTAPTAVLTPEQVASRLLGLVAAEHPPGVLEVRP